MSSRESKTVIYRAGTDTMYVDVSLYLETPLMSTHMKSKLLLPTQV